MKSYKKYLNEKLDDEDNIEIDNIEIPFIVKGNKIYLGDKEVANFSLDAQGKPTFIFDEKINEQNITDTIIDYFYDAIEKGLDIEGENLIKGMTVDIKNIETESDYETDSSGHEYSSLYAEYLDVYLGKIYINNILKVKQLEKIHGIVDQRLNDDYEPKFYGSHRTY